MSPFPPQITHGPAQNRIRDSAVISEQITVRSMVRYHLVMHRPAFRTHFFYSTSLNQIIVPVFGGRIRKIAKIDY
jgi:hypothetical protein